MASLASRIRLNSAYAAVSHGVRIVSNLLLFVGIARLYGLEAFGQFTAAHTMATLFLLAADFGFDTLLPSRVARAGPGDLGVLLGRYFTLKVFCAGAATAAMLVVSWMTDLPPGTALLVRLFSAYVLIGSLANFSFAVFKGREEFHHEARISLGSNLVLLVALVALWVTGGSVIAVAGAFLLTRGMIAIHAFLRLQKMIGASGLRLRTDGLRPLLQGVLVFGLHFVFGNLFFQIDTLLLTYLRSEGDVGIYQSAFKIAVLVLIVPDIAVTATLPALTHLHAVNREQWQEGGRLLARVLFLAAFPVAVFLGLSGDAIVRLVYGPSAVREAGVVLQLFAATVFVRFTVDAFALMLTTAERQIVRLWIVLGGTILNLALNAAIIPTHGAIGAAVVSLVTNAAVGAAYLLWSGMPVARWLGGRRTLAVVGVTAGVVSAAVVLTTPVPLVVGLGSALACGGAALFWGLKPAERSLLRAGAIPGWSRA